MSPNEKIQLAHHLAKLDRNDHLKLAKRAAQLRKLSLARSPGRIKDRDVDEEGEFRPNRRTKTLEEFMWQIVLAETVRELPSASDQLLQVIGVFRNGLELLWNGKPARARFRYPGMDPVAVGDEVYVDSSAEELVVTGVAPRRSFLARPDVDDPKKQRLIAANLDKVVIVVSVVSPPLHPRLIDRYLLAIQHGGCRPVLVINKMDLVTPDGRLEELAKLEPYRGLDLPVFECVAHEGLGILELREHLSGTLAAFVGHSGVGKSSLINAFDPMLAQEVGDVSHGYGRGTHTTTRSSLIDLGDLRVIDTPGIRSFGLWDIDAENLLTYFEEFQTAPRCRFSDCTHVHEPGCGVKLGVESGLISAARYDTYRRILAGL